MSEWTRDEMMTVAAARLLCATVRCCFVGIGLPSAACNLARLTHAPELVLIYESGTIGTRRPCCRCRSATASSPRPRPASFRCPTSSAITCRPGASTSASSAPRRSTGSGTSTARSSAPTGKAEDPAARRRRRDGDRGARAQVFIVTEGDAAQLREATRFPDQRRPLRRRPRADAAPGAAARRSS